MIDWLRRRPDEVPQVEIGGRLLPLAVRRNAAAKRMTMRLSPDGSEVRVTLPRWGRSAEALEFARSKADWLAAQLAKVPQAPDLEHGSKLPYRGRALALEAAVGRVLASELHASRECHLVSVAAMAELRAAWADVAEEAELEPAPAPGGAMEDVVDAPTETGWWWCRQSWESGWYPHHVIMQIDHSLAVEDTRREYGATTEQLIALEKATDRRYRKLKRSGKLVTVTAEQLRKMIE